MKHGWAVCKENSFTTVLLLWALVVTFSVCVTKLVCVCTFVLVGYSGIQYWWVPEPNMEPENNLSSAACKANALSDALLLYMLLILNEQYLALQIDTAEHANFTFKI